MIITLQQIKENDPCVDLWKFLLKSLPGYTMETCVSIEYILDMNGVDAAYWALKCLSYEDYCDLLAGVADSVSYLACDDRVHNIISIIRAYAKGEVAGARLDCARKDTMDSAVTEFIPLRSRDWAARCAAWSAVNAAHRGGWAVSASWETASGASWAVWAAAETTPEYTSRVAVRGDTKENARKKQWHKNEELMRSWISRQKHVDTRVGARK